MKKIILVSMYVIASVVMISCTNDEPETALKNNDLINVVADGGGTSGQNTLPPPK
jgi:hypothetical protein